MLFGARFLIVDAILFLKYIFTYPIREFSAASGFIIRFVAISFIVFRCDYVIATVDSQYF